MTVTLSTHWSSAHFYHQEKWTPEKNQKTFGKCFSDYGHGHDYRFEATWFFSKEADFSQNYPSLEQSLHELREHLDHHHVNFVIPEFKDKIPTTENLALYCQSFLQKNLTAKNLPSPSQIRLFETADLWVELS